MRSDVMSDSIRTEPLHDEHGSEVEGEVLEMDRSQKAPPGWRVAFGAAGAVVALLALAGVVPRLQANAALEGEAKVVASLVPKVEVTIAARDEKRAPIVLPGTVQPLRETPIYARANGYVRRWYVDIGAEVKKGDPLIELEIPDIDEELRQARAALRQSAASVSQAKSRADFARTTDRRYSALAPSGVVSQQQTEQYASDLEVETANVEAAVAARGNAEANVRRIEDLRAYGTIAAPFDGVVTMRTAEVGQLVVSGTGQGQGQPLFKVAEDDVVRIFVNVPQLYAGAVAKGADAPVTVREAPGRVFHGKVERTSRELDVATRSLLVEVDIANEDRALVSGMYAKVSFDIARQDSPLFIAATAAIVDPGGIRVAVVRDAVIHWQKVEVAGDQGDRLAIAKGLEAGASVVQNPSDRLTEGLHVEPVVAKPAP
jgi:RND family efflux transporter MFP subunit